MVSRVFGLGFRTSQWGRIVSRSINLVRNRLEDCGSRPLSLVPTVPTVLHRRCLSTKLATENAYSFKTNRAVKDCNVLENGRQVEITWDDKVTSRFHAVWLRFCCQCQECRHEGSNQRPMDVTSVPQPITINDVRIKDGVVEMRWSEDGHCGVIPQDFLRWYRYDKKALEEKNEAIRPLFLREKPIPEMSYTELSSEEGVYRWVKTLSDYGVCLLKGVPTEENYIEKVAHHIGPIRSTIYGEVFDVRTKPVASSFSFTSMELAHHMDQAAYEAQPGIQMLHCLRFDDSVVGGNTTFVDVYDIAEQLRVQDPVVFNALVKIPTLFERIHSKRKVFMQYQCPHIELNRHNEIVAVRWHTRYNGPVQVDFDDTELYFRAYQKFAQLILDYPYRKSLRLTPGDLVAFNNRRVAHGRERYESIDGERFLQGAYVGIDEFRSRVQDLSFRIGDGSRVRRVGNRGFE